MLQYHEAAAVPHGFRSSFRDWAPRDFSGRPLERGVGRWPKYRYPMFTNGRSKIF